MYTITPTSKPTKQFFSDGSVLVHNSFRFVSRPLSAGLTQVESTIGKVKILAHSMTLKENATILNNNYYTTIIHLTSRYELMGEQVSFQQAQY